MTDGDDTTDASDEGTLDDADTPDDERESGGSLADRLDGMRATLDEATGSVSKTVRRTGEALEDSTEGVRSDATDRAEAVAERTREGLDATRESFETVREGDLNLDLDEDGLPDRVPVERIPADRLPVDRLPVERLPIDRISADRPTVEDLPVEEARTRLDRTGRSVRRAGGDAGLRAVEHARPVGRLAAETGLRAKAGVAWGFDEVAHTLRNADTTEVALWGIGTSLAVSNPAIAAAYPTYALLSGAMAAGMGVGAYVSSHEDTPLDDVDPLTLGREARERSRRGRHLGSTGATAGALSAIGSHVAERADATGSARWLADADWEAVLEGARRAAEREGNDPWAPVFGGGLGLLSSYADDDPPVAGDEEVRRLLDDDLREEYDERIGEE